MTTRLEKTTLVTYTPGSPGSPGFAGQPYLPARTVWEPYQVCSYVQMTAQDIYDYYISIGATYQLVGGQWTWVLPPGTSGVQIPSSKLVCRDEFRLVNYPAQPYLPPIPATPGTPSSTSRNFQLGWNSRARSIAAMRASGRYRFTIPSTVVGAIAGLSAAPLSSGYADIRWGFKVTSGLLFAMESGVEVQNFGAATSVPLMIERAAGSINYYIDGVLSRTVSNSGETLYLTAALYSGGDSILDSSLEEFGSGIGAESFETFHAFGGTEAYGIGYAVLDSMLADGGDYASGGGGEVFLPLVAFGADAGGYSVGSEELIVLSAEGEAFEELTYAIGADMFLPLDAVGSGMTGSVGGGGETIGPLFVIGADAGGYAQAIEVLEITVQDHGEDFLAPDEATMFSVLLLASGYTMASDLLVIMNSSMEVTAVVAAQIVRPQTMTSDVDVDSSALTDMEIDAIMRSLASVRFLMSDAAAVEQVWALHLGVGGSTRYENYAFNSFAKVGAKYYGASSEGLFLLEGPDDAGANVESLIDFGNMNFGSSMRKKLPYCYLGAASDGRMVLKVEADGETFYYDLRNSSELMQQQRFELGRGLRAVYYHVSLLNTGGTLFDVDSIEFMPLPLTRRL